MGEVDTGVAVTVAAGVTTGGGGDDSAVGLGVAMGEYWKGVLIGAAGVATGLTGDGMPVVTTGVTVGVAAGVITGLAEGAGAAAAG